MPTSALQAVIDAPAPGPRASADLGVQLNMECRRSFLRTASSESSSSQHNHQSIDRGTQLSMESRRHFFLAASSSDVASNSMLRPKSTTLSGSRVDMQLQGRKAMLPGGLLARWNRMF